MRADTLLTTVILTIVLGACGGGADGSTPPDGATTPSSPAGTETSPSPDGRTYSTQAGGGFSFSYPASWSEGAPATGLIQVIVQAPPEDADEGFVPNINLVIEPLRVDADTDSYFESSYTW